MRSISRKLCVRLFIYGLQNLDRNFANLVAPPTDGSAKCLERYKEHLQLSNIPSISLHHWRRYPSLNWYEIEQKRGSKFLNLAVSCGPI